VEADAAGVSFTLDPVTGDRGKIVINANLGLGESVVSGRVTPDTFTVDKKSLDLIGSQLADKKIRIVLSESGTIEEAMDERTSKAPSISDEQAIAVARLAVRVEELEGRPVDVEWAIKDGEAFLLQSRPVTAVAPPPAEQSQPPPDWVCELHTPIDPRYPVYSNGNISEILPGCITPLSWSYVGPTIEHAFRAQGVELGSMEEGGPEYQVLGFFFHRPYICVSFLKAAARRTPGMSSDMIHEEFIGPVDKHTPPLPPADHRPGRLLHRFKLIGILLHKTRSMESSFHECEQLINDQRERATPEKLRDWSDAELVKGVRFTKEMARLSDVHIWASSFAVAYFALLRKLTRRWLGDEDGALAARLVTGIGSLPSANPAFALFELAQSVLASPALSARFGLEKDNRALYEALSADPTASSFHVALDRFLAKYGHRSPCEAEFRNPCWREDPPQVIGLVRNYLAAGPDSPEQVKERQKAVQAEAEKLVGSLFSPRRAAMRWILDKARRNIEYRERLKDLIVLRSDRARLIYAKLRDRLVERSRLADPDDVYFLLWPEVRDLIEGALSKEAAVEIVARRRREFEWNRSISLPKIIDGAPRPLEQSEAIDSEVLTGMGVSPGRVRARARVILDPSQDSHIEPGEILVAPVTDAGWTPLFINAAGLVVEVGGLLSHGSVVAREYGLPAVVGVTGLIGNVRSGDLIELDGSAGTVRKL